jgi:hypothetical protein
MLDTCLDFGYGWALFSLRSSTSLTTSIYNASSICTGKPQSTTHDTLDTCAHGLSYSLAKSPFPPTTVPTYTRLIQDSCGPSPTILFTTSSNPDGCYLITAGYSTKTTCNHTTATMQYFETSDCTGSSYTNVEVFVPCVVEGPIGFYDICLNV